MGSGREGSPSPIGEGKADRHRHKQGGMTASMYHALQREELLGFHENIPINLANALPGATLRVSPTPSLSPQKLAEVAEPLPKQIKQRLRSPKSSSQLAPLDTQEVPATRASLRRSPRKEAEDLPPQEEVPVVLGRRSSKGRDKSPLNSRRFKSEMIPVEEEQLDLDLRKKHRADGLEVQEKSPSAPERHSLRSGRSTRRSRMELQEITQGGDNVEVEALGKITRRGQGRPQTRHHKRKAPDSPLPIVEPEAVIPGKPNSQAPQLSRNSSTSSRRSRRVPEAKSTRERTSWLQYMADLIMWRDTPKSAFVFGAGSFFVLSSCFTLDLHFSLVTIVSYLALFYLASVFFYKSFFRRGSIDLDSISTNYELSEADALRIVRLILPPFNALFAKIRELFSGDPATTLKLACVLWLLAECGHLMTIWTLARLGFFGIFTIPKLYSCYSAQLHGQGEYILLRGWEVWNCCSHKKAVLAAVATLAWNLSSVAARVSGAFILIVALRLYQQSLRVEPANQNEVAPEEDIQNVETDANDITGLELMRMRQPGV
eukprot:Gb_25024 [translate_table: standard]